MAEKQKEYPSHPPDQAKTAVPDSSDAPKKRTLGNKIYDFVIYGSVAYAGVWIMSMLSAHQALHGKNPKFQWWRNFNDWSTGKIHKGLASTIFKGKSAEEIAPWAKDIALILTLGAGGTTLMWPLKWLEDNRQKNACKIDKALGTLPENAEIAAEEPKQTWTSVLSGRALAWGAAFGSYGLMGPKLSNKISHYFGEKTAETWLKLRPKDNPVNVRNWANIAAFDAVFTGVTAAITYVFSRFIAKGKDKKLPVEDALVIDNPLAPEVLQKKFYENLPARPHKTQKDFSEYKSKLPSQPSESFTSLVKQDPSQTSPCR